MCRYGMQIYKPHFACFYCRKSYKPILASDLHKSTVKDDNGLQIASCPQCSRHMKNMGKDFVAPKQHDTEAWKVLEILESRGYIFQTCGCSGPGYRPRRMRDLRPFFQNLERERLAQERRCEIERRATELKAKRNKRVRAVRDKQIARVQQKLESPSS